MRKLLQLVAAFGIVLGPVGVTFAQDEPKAILEKAIKAHGGEKNLLKATQTKGKGKLHLLDGIAFTNEVHVQYPDKFKHVMQMEIMGMQITQVELANGDKYALIANGMNIDLDDKLKAEFKEGMHGALALSLVPLRGKEYELSLLGEMKVEGQDAVGVKVTRKGYRDLNLYFAKATGLVVKEESRAFDFMTMQEVNQEIFLSDYKDVDGVKASHKSVLLRDGKKFLEMEVTETKVFDKLDDGVFKP